MKTVRNIWKDIITDENIKAAFYEASKGKRNRNDVKRILNNIDYHVEVVKRTLIETMPNDKTNGYIPRKSSHEVINEGTSKKKRNIEKPHYQYDQVIHHAIMRQLVPHIMKSTYTHVYGSIPKRGAHSGKKAIEKWLRNDPKNTKYCAKLDIRHFYESVDHQVLKQWLSIKIQDVYLLEILDRIIDVHVDKTIFVRELEDKDAYIKTGLPLGFYTSGWFGNWLLQPLDYFIKQQLHVKYYVRYMDDMVLFGANKKQLHKVVNVIENYLNNRLNLKMKYNHQVFRFEYYSRKKKRYTGRPLDFMGFVFHRNRTCLRKSIMLRATRKANNISKKECVSWYDATSMISYMGYIDNTDTYNVYVRYTKPKVNIKRLKVKISYHARKEHKKHGMEKSRKRHRAENTRHYVKPVYGLCKT